MSEPCLDFNLHTDSFRFIAYDVLKESKNILLAGSQWARVAQLHIFNNISLISVKNLMVSRDAIAFTGLTRTTDGSSSS